MPPRILPEAGPQKGVVDGPRDRPYTDLVNENFQSLMQQLGEAINHAVLNSGEVDAALDHVRANGIYVFLVLEATICVRRASASGRGTDRR